MQIKKILVAAIVIVACAGAASAQVKSFASLPQGSAGNTMSTAIAAQARESIGMKLVVQPFGGSNQFQQIIENGQAEFAVNDINDLIVAVNGQHGYDNPMKNLRVVARIIAVQVGLFVKADSGITSVEELVGKKVPSGWDAFPTGAANVAGILSAVGLGMDDVQAVPVPELIRGADALASGRTDTALFAVGAPKVAEVDASVGGVRFLSINADEAAAKAIKTVRPAYYLSKADPAPFRVGVPETMDFLTWDYVLLAGAHVPDEDVKALLSVVFDEAGKIGAAFPPLRAINIDTAYRAYPDVEYHAGAKAFFEERGIEQQAAD
ncbi:hypothetical protein DSM110093_03120 [Sulfitobacter sp. DSM 110093]|nr:hypothetical protein DSM110093_03120 [Sulfitobacter sp. DSM 110093]